MIPNDEDSEDWDIKYRIVKEPRMFKDVYFVEGYPKPKDEPDYYTLWYKVNHEGKLWGFHIIREPIPFKELSEAEDFKKRLEIGKVVIKEFVCPPLGCTSLPEVIDYENQQFIESCESWLQGFYRAITDYRMYQGGLALFGGRR